MQESIDRHEEVGRELEEMTQIAERVHGEILEENENMGSEGGKNIDGKEGVLLNNVKDELRRDCNMPESADSEERVTGELGAMTQNVERVERQILEDNMNKRSEDGKMGEGKEAELLNLVTDELKRNNMPGSDDIQEDVIREFEIMTQNAVRVQQETLEAILQRNSGTEYLKKWGILDGSADPDPVQHFKSCVPVVCYSDLEPYIQRIADGDTSPILTADPITAFSLTSGIRDGKQKLVPFNDSVIASKLEYYRITQAYTSGLFPAPQSQSRYLQFIYGSRQFRTKGGLEASNASGLGLRSKGFKTYKESNQWLACSPEEVVFGFNYEQSLYCHLLCGLLYSHEVVRLTSSFAYSIVEAFRTFENVWQQLCNDIKEGTLNEKITVPSMRESVSKILKPNPELAQTIYEICEKLLANNWYGVIHQLWPYIKYIGCIITGSMEPYVKKLRHYAGSLLILPGGYAASEGYFGVNIDPAKTTFTVVPSTAFFEFIPQDKESQAVPQDKESQAEPVGLTEVEIGKEYEVIITTFGGLYRYRLDDVVKVNSFYNSSPRLSYAYPKNSILSCINIDKTTERDVQLIVNKAAELLNKETDLEVVDFTSYADLSSEPGHYVIFWELSRDIGDAHDEVYQKCCCILDEALVDELYFCNRKENRIGALELRIVAKGTFRKIVDHSMNLGAAASQFKTPRCISSSNQSLLNILNNGILATYKSAALFM